ncbi:acyltransferase [Planktomarina sp.]|nr:acyltransferase [Planktomarina sp.]
MSQFRALNKPQLIDRLWSFFSLRIYKLKVSGVFLEYNAQLYRFTENITLSKDVYVKRNATIGCANPHAKVLIGERTTLGFNSIIMASKCISIGSDCMIAPNVYIVDSNHGTQSDQLFNTQNNKVESVKIGDNVWIGSGVIILPGVTICDNIVVGAGSVVTRSLIEPGTYYGTPAEKR